MNLYLSSYRIGNRAAEMKSLAPNSRAVVVANAIDHIPSEVRKERVQREFEDLKALGFDPVELDLREHFDSERHVASSLESIGLIWVTGGNVFLLRKAFDASGFDSYLLRNTKSEILYGGYSAGACVLAPTLRGLEIVDDVMATADGYPEGVIWNGLNLIPFSIAPHYRSDHPESAQVESTVEFFITKKIPFIALRDGEVEIRQTRHLGR